MAKSTKGYRDKRFEDKLPEAKIAHDLWFLKASRAHRNAAAFIQVRLRLAKSRRQALAAVDARNAEWVEKARHELS